MSYKKPPALWLEVIICNTSKCLFHSFTVLLYLIFCNKDTKMKLCFLYSCLIEGSLDPLPGKWLHFFIVRMSKRIKSFSCMFTDNHVFSPIIKPIKRIEIAPCFKQTHAFIFPFCISLQETSLKGGLDHNPFQ